MNTDINLLESLDAVAEVLREGNRQRIQREFRIAADHLSTNCSEEEIAGLAILVRETQRGNLLTTMRALQGSTKIEYRIPVRWDVVIGMLVRKKLVTVLTNHEEEATHGELMAMLGSRGAEELRIGLTLKDPTFDPSIQAGDHPSNRDYLRGCLEYLGMFIDALQMDRGRQRTEQGAEQMGSIDDRYEYLRRKTETMTAVPPLEQMTRLLELDRFEWTIVLYLLREDLAGNTPEVRNLLELAGTDLLDRYEARVYFEDGATLVRLGILELEGNHPLPQQEVSLHKEISGWLLEGGPTPAVIDARLSDCDVAPFRSNEEYLDAWLELVRNLIEEGEHLPAALRKLQRRQRSLVPVSEQPAFRKFERRVLCTDECYPLEKMARNAGLDTNERIILAIGIYMALRDGSFGISNAVALLAGEKLLDRLRMQRYFATDAPLLREGLIETDEGFMASRDFTVPQDVLQTVIADDRIDGNGTTDVLGMSFFERRTPRHTLADAVLPPTVMDDLGDALGSLSGALRSILRDWGVERITAGRDHGSLLLLFSGPAGTGKTFTAEAFAGALGRDLLITDAGKLLSKWYSGSEHNLQQMFRSYSRLAKSCEHVPLLLLNECDQLLAQRAFESGRSTDRTEHRFQNILLDEFERFPGVLIATTNLLETLDNAFSRRFDYKIVFPQPDVDARHTLWQAHIPGSVPMDKDIDLRILAQRYHFSGGQIAVAAANALRIAARRGDRLTEVDLRHACDAEERSCFEAGQSIRANMGFHLAE